MPSCLVVYSAGSSTRTTGLGVAAAEVASDALSVSVVAMTASRPATSEASPSFRPPCIMPAGVGKEKKRPDRRTSRHPELRGRTDALGAIVRGSRVRDGQSGHGSDKCSASLQYQHSPDPARAYAATAGASSGFFARPSFSSTVCEESPSEIER